jgi:hypothetical protein
MQISTTSTCSPRVAVGSDGEARVVLGDGDEPGILKVFARLQDAGGEWALEKSIELTPAMLHGHGLVSSEVEITTAISQRFLPKFSKTSRRWRWSACRICTGQRHIRPSFHGHPPCMPALIMPDHSICLLGILHTCLVRPLKFTMLIKILGPHFMLIYKELNFIFFSLVCAL